MKRGRKKGGKKSALSSRVLLKRGNLKERKGREGDPSTWGCWLSAKQKTDPKPRYSREGEKLNETARAGRLKGGGEYLGIIG